MTKLVIENRQPQLGFSDKLYIYDPDSELGRLASNSQTLVKLRFVARPTIADYAFKEFKTSKSTK